MWKPRTIAEARVGWLSQVPASGVLPMRTVIVPNEAAAHAWRRDVVVTEPSLLVGTQFVTPLGAALAVLATWTSALCSRPEKKPCVPLVKSQPSCAKTSAFEHFDQAVLREGRGWGEALSSTLE